MATRCWRRLGDGWVAWNRGDGAYRELGSIKPARIEWSFASARGHYEALGGRSITSVSVDPSGTYIALGTGARIAGSGVRGAVHVLEAVGGAEVYRRYLAPGSGGEVAFLGRDYLAVGTATGGSDQIEVLRVGANPADS